MAAYGPYTVVRVFIVAGIYWLSVFIPDILGITILQPAWEPHWPLVMALITPFAYLALFSGLGTLILKSTGGLGGLGKWIDQVYENIRHWGKVHLVEKLDDVPLEDIQALFCGHLQEYIETPQCMIKLKEMAKFEAKIPGGTSILQKRGIILSYVAWMKKMTETTDPSLWMNILRSVVDEAPTHSSRSTTPVPRSIPN
jgi:hypothetical protein